MRFLEENNVHMPESWVILEILTKRPTVVYKVFGMWSGGYLHGDSWRMNSGIDKMGEDDNHYSFTGFSGSTYICKKGAYRIHGYGGSVLSENIEKCKEQSCAVTIIETEEEAIKALKFLDNPTWRSTHEYDDTDRVY